MNSLLYRCETRRLLKWVFASALLLLSVGEARATSIDIAFLYTSKTKNYLGGNDGLKAYRALVIASANKAFSDSGVGITLRPSGLKKVASRSSANTGKLLRQLDSRSWPFQKLDSYQRNFKCDLICMLIPYGYDAAGRANVPLSPRSKKEIEYNSEAQCFSVVSVSDSSTLTFAHEIGHNLGCYHALLDQRRDTVHNAKRFGVPRYAFGYRFYVPAADPMEEPTLYGTVMSYDGLESGLFSNPHVAFMGVPAGVSEHADNARLLNQSRKVVSRYNRKNRGSN